MSAIENYVKHSARAYFTFAKPFEIKCHVSNFLEMTKHIITYKRYDIAAFCSDYSKAFYNIHHIHTQ